MLGNRSTSRIGLQLKRALVIAKKDFRIYSLKPPVLISGVLFPLFLFLAFSIGRKVLPSSLIPGLIGITLFSTASSVAPIIVPWETRMKTLERLISTPISIPAILLGDILAGFAFGVVFSAIPLLLGMIFLGTMLTHPIVLVLGMLLSAFCFSTFGSLLSAPPTDNPSSVMMLSTLIKFPLIFISGVFIPIDQMPTWGRIIGRLSPLTYFTELTRYSLQGVRCYPTSLNITMLLIFIAVFLTADVLFHKKSLTKRL
ncbi:MAG: ABC transporter permease [Candidatus Latescibacteria bacterium]|nr:ABC transporter permease [Candidatus Latescibacterota bacterium]